MQYFSYTKEETAMGTPVNYANLLMEMFETSRLNDLHKKTGKKPLI